MPLTPQTRVRARWLAAWLLDQHYAKSLTNFAIDIQSPGCRTYLFRPIVGLHPQLLCFLPPVTKYVHSLMFWTVRQKTISWSVRKSKYILIPNAGLLLDHRLWRWPSNKPTLGQGLVLTVIDLSTANTTCSRNVDAMSLGKCFSYSNVFSNDIY